MVNELKIVSLFSGCGGLDLGFTNAGFKLVFANDNDLDVKETFEKNHGVELDTRSVENIPSSEIPNIVGIIGGPPCQSWSLAGAMRGLNDKRGRVFYEYLRILADKKPLFFLAENVAGIVSKAHIAEFNKILSKFEEIGYTLNWKLLNSIDYGVPQERKRVIVVGYRKDLGLKFDFNNIKKVQKVSLKQAIGDLNNSTPAKEKNWANEKLDTPNHEHFIGNFSSMYMSRNRKKDWSDASFTIQAGARHAPLHPSAPEMISVAPDVRVFKDKDAPIRRLSVRECARIQTFPDDFIFQYNIVSKGYKMIGNAVPVKLAEVIANQIVVDLKTKGY